MKAHINARIPIAPIAALTPTPALAPVDKRLRLGDRVEVDVSMFQPLNGMATIEVEELMARVSVTTPGRLSARYEMVWPGVKVDRHVPTALPGSPF
jgi:hypothetical protein